MTKEITIDAKNKSVGRVASEVSKLIQGKDLPEYVPNRMSDVKVSVINLSKVRFTGKKLTGKIYYRHTGYIGHLKKESLKEVFQKKPTEAFRRALRGMLPKNKFRDRWLKNVKLTP